MANFATFVSAQAPFSGSTTPGFTGPAAPANVATLPDPKYCSQLLFLMPYKWDSGSTATDATAVKLYLSQDQGQTWNEIADAKPEVQFFNYHAPSDGEYWFSMRTIDSAGKAWPEGPHQAEMRVIIDTQNPTVTAFSAQLRADGTVSAAWQASDTNINTSEAKLQYRTPSDTTWHDVPSGSIRTPSPGFLQGESRWQVPAGTTNAWVRIAVRDLAGNGRDAGTRARVEASASAQLASSPVQRLPVGGATPGAPANSASSNPPTAARTTTNWTSVSAPTTNSATQSPAAYSNAQLPLSQRWPSDGESPIPLGTPRSEGGNRLAAPSLAIGSGTVGIGNTPHQSNATELIARRQGGRPNVAASEPFSSPFQLPHSTASASGATTAGGRAAARLPNLHNASARPFGPPNAATHPSTGDALPLNQLPTHSSSSVSDSRSASTPHVLQHLNSLDFEISYDVDTAGTFGVTRVELWGTPNGGQSWKRLSVDVDNRSPILAAVPAPGDYGLKIVVETAGGIDPVRPRPGDKPEMLVRIDTTPPVAKLTGISQGAAQNADHLMVQWQPAASRVTAETVSLAYSSQPTGPWVTAASTLPNNGHYAWRLARHIPARFYLRLEVRDKAGNIGVDQTQVPVTVNLPTPSGRLGAVRSLQ